MTRSLNFTFFLKVLPPSLTGSHVHNMENWNISKENGADCQCKTLLLKKKNITYRSMGPTIGCKIFQITYISMALKISFKPVNIEYLY